ncbi:MAG: hypothetical protein ABJF86_03510 [Tateyamaria sp.]|uniref:hypothetical protein n=1 Tax=Tateyamaria sp. TaxID=1929288 RepID=UPI0032820A0B
MSDNSHANFSRSSGTSGRGVLIAFVVVVCIVAFIALIGSFGTDQPNDNAITPAVQSPVLPAVD